MSAEAKRLLEAELESEIGFYDVTIPEALEALAAVEARLLNTLAKLEAGKETCQSER